MRACMHTCATLSNDFSFMNFSDVNTRDVLHGLSLLQCLCHGCRHALPLLLYVIGAGVKEELHFFFK